MRVVSVSSLLPETNYFRYLAQALEKAGVDITVYSDTQEENLHTGLKKVRLVWNKSIWYPFRILWRLWDEKKPLIVHLHHEVGMFGGPKTALLFPFLLLSLKVFRVKVVTTIHAVVAPDQIDSTFLETFAFPPSPVLAWPVKLFFIFLYLFIVRFSDAVIVHTPGLSDLLIQHYRASKDKITVIHHGVPEQVPLNNPKPEAAWSNKLDTDKFACYFGYFHRRKGLEYIIDGFSSLAVTHPDFKLVLAGGALQEDYQSSLKQKVTELGLVDRVIFTGFVSQMELYWLLENSLFVLQPATYSISASGPLAQVIAFEKPVIGNQVGVLAEEIEDGVNGLLALTRSSKDICQKMKLLLDNDDLRLRLSRGMARIHRERGWPRIAELTKEVYSHLV